MIDIYNITKEGSDYLAFLLLNQTTPSKSKVKVSSEGLRETFTRKEDLPKFDNVHNLQFTVELRKEAEIWFPNERQMNNWKAKYDWLGGVYVERTPKNLIFRLSVKAFNEWEALAKGYRIIFRLMDQLETAYGIELGHPIMTRKPHYTIVGDKVAESVADSMTVRVKDIGHIDKSKDTGELEYYTPELVGDYIRLPVTVKEIREHQQTQQTQLNQITEVLDFLAKDKLKKETINSDPGEMFG